MPFSAVRRLRPLLALLLAWTALLLTAGPPPAAAQVGGQAGTLNSVSVPSSNITYNSFGIVATLTPLGGNTIVYFRWRPQGSSGNWAEDVSQGRGNTVSALARNLTPSTTYDVQASLSRTFPSGQIVTTTGRTAAPPAISLTGLTLGTATATSIPATVTYGTGQGTIYLRYRAGSAAWLTRTIPVSLSDARSMTVRDITGLSPSTTYTFEASVNSGYNPKRTATRRTAAAPTLSVTNISYDNIGETSARATVTLSATPLSSTRVYLRLRVSGGSYGAAQSNTTTARTVQFNLSPLTTSTTYNAQAATNASFSGAYTGQSFTTTRSSAPASVSDIQMGNISYNAASALVLLANAEATNTVYFRYRPAAATAHTAWTQETGSTTTASIRFNLSDLAASTSYRVEASLQSTFPAGGATEVTTFPTSAPPEQALVPNQSVYLEPDPSAIRYYQNTNHEFTVRGESQFFPVSVSSGSISLVRVFPENEAPAMPCDPNTANPPVENLTVSDKFELQVCSDTYGNVRLYVHEQSGDQRQLAFYNLPLNRREQRVTVETLPVPGSSDPGGDFIGLAIVINALCGVAGFSCDTILLRNVVVLAAVGILYAVPVVSGVYAGFPAGGLGIGTVLALIGLSLGYLLAGLPLWMVTIAVGGVAMLGLLGLISMMKSAGRV